MTADSIPAERDTTTRRRVLPVVGWLQVGVAAAGIGIALAAAPAASADSEAGARGSMSGTSALWLGDCRF